MQEPTLLILTALAAQPLYGYGIILSVIALSYGELKLRPGTLYGALDRVERPRRDATAAEQQLRRRPASGRPGLAGGAA